MRFKTKLSIFLIYETKYFMISIDKWNKIFTLSLCMKWKVIPLDLTHATDSIWQIALIYRTVMQTFQPMYKNVQVRFSVKRKLTKSYVRFFSRSSSRQLAKWPCTQILIVTDHVGIVCYALLWIARNKCCVLLIKFPGISLTILSTPLLCRCQPHNQFFVPIGSKLLEHLYLCSELWYNWCW